MGKVSENDHSLQQDVTAFASQLGLGKAENFDYSDFNPDLAKSKLGGTAKSREQRDAKKPRNLPPGQDQDQGQVTEPIAKRPWQGGSGIRPGAKAGKSLIADSESTLWYEQVLPPATEASPAITEAQDVDQLFQEAQSICDEEAAGFMQSLKKKNRADFSWLEEVRQSGTTADKLAAMSLLLQESPIANLKSLDEVLRWATKRSGARHMAGEAIAALQEIFLANLLPDSRLVFFEEQKLGILGTGKERRQRLLYYYMEDAVKKRFLEFVKVLQEASRDNLQFIKMKAMRAIFSLLKDKPEQEALLLSILVDKLGDPDRKIASNAGYLLGQLLEEHPAMTLVVVQETEHFVFKPHLTRRAIYYAVVFLNQLTLTKSPTSGPANPAEKLINVYFSLFRLLLEKKIGNGAIDKPEQEPKKKDRKAPRKFRHKGGKPKYASKAKPEAKPTLPEADAEDAKLLAALLAGVRRAFPYINTDQASSVMEAHAPSLFRLMHTAGFGVAVQALSLLFQLLDVKNTVSNRFYRALYSMLLSQELARSGKTAMFLSILFKALKADVSPAQTIAFFKRLLQAAAVQLPNFTCGCILLISELAKEKSSLLIPFLQPEEDTGDQDRLEADPESVTAEGNGPGEDEGQSLQNKAEKKTSKTYDPMKRDPLHSHADFTCAWEIVPMMAHVHPSVSAMAQTLVTGIPIDYSGDPLQDLSTTSFLDQFIMKKPKKQQGKNHFLQSRPAANLSASSLPAEQKSTEEAANTAFFHKFFEVKARREAAGQRPAKRKRKAAAHDEDGLPSDAESLEGSEASSQEVDDFLDDVEDLEENAVPGVYDDLAEAMSESDTEQGGGGTSDGSDVSAADTADSSDVNPMDLEGPTDEESESSASTDRSQSSSDGEWIMAGDDEGDDRKHAKRSHKKKKGKVGDRDNVFAPAEEFAHLLEGRATTHKKSRRGRPRNKSN